MLKQGDIVLTDELEDPAAFRRLCVETYPKPLPKSVIAQPPSGGCVLKPQTIQPPPRYFRQPPSGGCVLKLGIN